MHALHVFKKPSKTSNGGQKDFELDLMKEYNINSFSKNEKLKILIKWIWIIRLSLRHIVFYENLKKM